MEGNLIMNKNVCSDNVIEAEAECCLSRISMGFPILDQVLGGGIAPGLILCESLSDFSGDAIGGQLLDNFLFEGKDCLYLSCEKSEKVLIAQSISRKSFKIGGKSGGITVSEMQMRSVMLNETKQDVLKIASAQTEAERKKLVFQDMSGGKVDVVKLEDYIKCNWVIVGKNVPVIMLDCWKGSHIYRNQYWQLRNLAIKYGVPIICVVYTDWLSFYTGVNTVEFSDVEEIADVILRLRYRGMGRKGFNYSCSLNKNPKELEIVLIKDRFGGSGVLSLLDFYPEYALFTEASEKVMNKTCGRKQLSNKAILKQYPDLQIVNINF